MPSPTRSQSSGGTRSPDFLTRPETHSPAWSSTCERSLFLASRRALPEGKLSIGQHVVVAEDVEEQYEDIARRILTITAVYDHEGEDEGASPCFDETMESYLYEFHEIDLALYGVELTVANVSLPKRPRLYQSGQTIYLRPVATPLTIVALIEPRL